MNPAQQFADLFIDNEAGEFLYFLIAVGVSFGSLLIALDQRYRSQREVAAGRYFLALVGVLMAWLALGAGRIYTAVVDSADPNLLIPPLERASNALVLLLLTWALLVAESNKKEIAARLVLWLMILVIAGGYYFTVIRWESAVDSEAFNQHSLGLAWTLIPVLIMGLGIALLFLRFSFAADIPLKLMLFTVAIAGHVFTLYLMGTDRLEGNFSGEIRVTMLVVLTLLPVLVYRMVIDRFRETVGEVSGWVQTVTAPVESVPSALLPAMPTLQQITAQPPESPAASAQREALSLLKSLGVMLEKTNPREIPGQIARAVAQTLKADIVAVAAVDNPNWADLIAAYDAIHQTESAGMVMDLDSQPTLVSAIELNIQCVLLPTRSSDEISDLFRRLDAQFTGPLGPAYFQPLSRNRQVIGMLILAMPYTARLFTDEERNLLEGLGPIAARLLAISRESLAMTSLAPGASAPLDEGQQSREQAVRNELQRQVESTQQQVSTLNAQVVELKSLLEHERAKLSALAEAGQSDMSITQQINLLSQQREGLSQEREELVTALNQARSLFVSATAAGDDEVYMQMVESLEKEKNSLLAERERLEKELRSLQSAPEDQGRLAEVIDTLTAEKERLGEEHQKLKNEISDAEAQLAELGIEGGLLGYAQMVAHLTEERNRFLGESKRALAERDMLMRERHAYAEQAERELERSQQISMLEVELSRLAADREAVLKQRDALKAERDSLNGQRDEWLEARIRLTEQYDLLRKQYERARKLLDSESVSSETLPAVIEQDTRVDLEGIKNRLYEVEENRSELEFDLIRARDDIDLLEKEVERLRGQSERVAVSPQDMLTAETMVALAQELRTPLTSIMGYNEVVLGESMGILGETQRQFLQRIQVNVEQLMHMIENLIRVPAIDRGKLSLAPKKIDVADLVDDAITSSSAQYREKGLTLHLEIAPNLPPIVADRDAMHQILTRLLTNAYLASPADSAVQVVATHWPDHEFGEGDERDVIYFGITDQGGGIREEDIRRVFARAYRAENPVIEGLGDKGAGLAVARALVEAHGGKIWAEAMQGESTTFKVLIPVDHHFGEKDLMRGNVRRLIDTLTQSDEDDSAPARAKFLPEETET